MRIFCQSKGALERELNYVDHKTTHAYPFIHFTGYLIFSSSVTFKHIATHNICLPLVSIGNPTIATNAAKIKPPLTKTGAFGLALGIFAAMIGAQSPAILFKQLEIPVPVPRLGAGKTSGV